MPRMSDEDAAFCVAQWCSGIQQREIAAAIGRKGATGVCQAIGGFILKYLPDQPVDYYGHLSAQDNARRLAAGHALTVFRQQRGDI